MKNKVKGMAKDVALIGVQCVRFGAAVMTLCYNGVYLICEDIEEKLRTKES